MRAINTASSDCQSAKLQLKRLNGSDQSTSMNHRYEKCVYAALVMVGRRDETSRFGVPSPSSPFLDRKVSSGLEQARPGGRAICRSMEARRQRVDRLWVLSIYMLKIGVNCATCRV